MSARWNHIHGPAVNTRRRTHQIYGFNSMRSRVFKSHKPTVGCDDRKGLFPPRYCYDSKEGGKTVIGNISLTTIPVTQLQFTSLATRTLFGEYDEIHEMILVPSGSDLLFLSHLADKNKTMSGQHL